MLLTTKTTDRPEASLSDVIEAYEKLHDACLDQARVAAGKWDIHTVYLWVKQGLAAEAKARKLKQHGVL